MARARAWLYVWYGCGIAGIGLLTWASADWERAMAFQQMAMRGKGMVIGAREENLGEGRSSYFSRVEFMAANGRRYKFSSENGKPRPPRIGDEIAVLYDPGTPDRARIDEPDDAVLWRLLWAGMGLCLTVIGLSPVWMRWRAGRPLR